jgi:hypothetical protein
MQWARRRSSTVSHFLRRRSAQRIGRRPFFDGSAALSSEDRAEYASRSQLFGIVDEPGLGTDEGPAQGEAGVALGDQANRK